jgi:hypothetical protein
VGFESVELCVFFWNTFNFGTMLGTTLNPYAGNNYSLMINDTRLSVANAQTGLSDIMTGLIIFSSTNRGIAGKTSEDLGSGCISASSRYNTIPSDTANQNYLIINPVAGGLVIKVQS